MAKIISIDPSKDERWDRFVENHPFGWICHLSAWKRILEDSFPHMRGHFFTIIDEKGEIKAGLPIYEVRSRLMGNRLISIPFATFSDPLVSNIQEFYLIFDHIKNIINKGDFNSIEIKMFNFYNFLYDDNNIEPNLFKTHILNLNNGIEELRRKFHRTCVRRNINRAIRSGLELRIGISEEDWAIFYRLYISTRRRLGLPSHPYNFILNLKKYLNENDKVKLLLAERNNRVIGALLLLKYKNRVSAEYIGTNNKYHLNTNVFLYWKAIEWAKECKAEYFDFGRTSSTNRGLMEFKGHWGTQVLNLPILYYPKLLNRNNNNEKKYSYKLVHLLCRITPEVLHPYLGKLIYQYLW